MKNKKILCMAMIAALSASLFTGCKPSVPDGTEEITPSEPTVTTVKTQKEDNIIEEEPVEPEKSEEFAAPIGTNGDKDDMNSNLDVILSVKYGSEGHFYDSEATYGYLKNKDTLIFDSPMFDLAYDYTFNHETGELSAVDSINVATAAIDIFFKDVETVENILQRFENIDNKAIAKRLYSDGVKEYIKNYIEYSSEEGYKVKNESSVYAAIYKSVANYYNAKFFGTAFTAGTNSFEGDPELVYNYTLQNGGIVTSMLNTKDASGFEMSVDSYAGAVIVAKTRYKITGSKNGLYQEYYKTDTLFLVPVIENGSLMFKIDFVFSPTDYIYSYTDNPKYDENMNLIPKEVVTAEDGCVYFKDN